MGKLVAASLIGCVVFAGCADLEKKPSASGWSIGGGNDTVGLSADCAESLEPIWFSEQPSMWYQPSFFGFSPNSGLLLRTDALMTSGMAFRAADGEQFYASVGPYPYTVDSTWELEARGQAYTRDINVVQRSTEEIVATVELDAVSGRVAGAAFGPNSEHLSVLSCVDERLRVTVWSVADDASVLELDLEAGGRCNGYYSSTPELEYTPDGSALVMTLPNAGKLAYVDLQNGQVTQVLAHEPTEGTHQMLPVEGVLDLAVHPSGHLVATSGADGKVRFWELPNLEPVGGALHAGVAAVNLNTYAPPHRVSPLAWTPDGSLLAMMSIDGEVVLRERRGDVVSTLSAPAIEDWAPEGTTDGVVNPPMAIAFDETGQIGVGSYLSAGIWTCIGAVPEHREGELDAQITFDGPREVRANEYGAFRVQVDGVDGPVVMRVVVNGEAHVWPQHSGTFNWYAREPGTVQMLLEVDDGSASAIRELTVEVTPDSMERR